jgi:hypothetical protein
MQHFCPENICSTVQVVLDLDETLVAYLILFTSGLEGMLACCYLSSPYKLNHFEQVVTQLFGVSFF